jgi:hypothetical protein
MSQPNATALPPLVNYVAGSSQKICQLTGETDYEFNEPTTSQTETRYGLVRADHGYSFEHDGRLFFLFGDTEPAPTFNGKPNLDKDPPRDHGLDNDAIGYVSNIASISSLDQCLRLDFTVDEIGAYKNPVVLNAQGQPAITLRVDESPMAGIDDGGRMFVTFKTDNYVYPTPGPTKEDLGQSTRAVVGVSDDDANTWHYLYDLSDPSKPGASDAKFVNNAFAQGQDGYLYIWGTYGGTQYRHSPVFLARKPVGSMSTLNPIQYLQSVNNDGTPVFASSETDATPLFHDSPTDCAGEVGVEWNQFVDSWVMLYECPNNTPANPHGIWMRVADQPWGPWSPPQTIFNKDDGLCKFIHRAVNSKNPTPCDNLSTPGPNGEDRSDQEGATYAPYPIPRFNTGDASKGASTFYWNMATFNPYTQVIMKTTIQRLPVTTTGTTQTVTPTTSGAVASTSSSVTSSVETVASNTTIVVVAVVIAVAVLAAGALYLMRGKRKTRT